MTHSSYTPYPLDSTTRECCGGIGGHTPDCPDYAPVVELDQPTPELARWQERAAVDLNIEHDGDVSTLLPIPRPSWSDPDYDYVSTRLSFCEYRSEPAEMALTRLPSINQNGMCFPSKIDVSAKMAGIEGLPCVGVTTKRIISGKVEPLGVTLTLAEANELAELLIAAANLAVSE